MKLFSKKTTGRVVKVTAGLLNDKYAMVAKTYKEGVGVIVEEADRPSCVPSEYNAIWVHNDNFVELPQEQQELLKVKFPNPDQFE